MAAESAGDPPASFEMMTPKVEAAAKSDQNVASFELRLAETSMWAAMRASRAQLLAFEWLAVGFALAAAYLLVACAPAQKLVLIDYAIVVFTAGGGIVMYWFEKQSALALRELSERLVGEKADAERSDKY